ncbi:MAG: PIG-L family deacetylase [Patescibacteria group bacterium]|nr:PIG-L family deacetylase [Patescibacteria group bacterium]
MKKLLQQALSLNNLRKVIGLEIFWSAIKSNLNLQILDNPQSLLPPSHFHRKILFLSPHPDDDVFACGGTIYKHTKAGDKVTVLYLCDGSKGNLKGIRDSSLISKRKKEAQASAEIIGIEELIFWSYKDGKLESNSIALKGLKTLIDELKPEIIYVPSFLDNHPDHRATAEILYRVLKNNTDLKTLIAMYELWTPFFPNRLIDISNVINIKKEAINAHITQLKSRGYEKVVLALNQYRAEINNIKGYAEAFFVSNPAIFKKLFEIINIVK